VLDEKPYAIAKEGAAGERSSARLEHDDNGQSLVTSLYHRDDEPAGESAG
jgi:hypothetical protein